MKTNFLITTLSVMGRGAGSVQAGAIDSFKTDEAGFVDINDAGNGEPNGPFAVAGLPSFTVEADPFDWTAGNMSFNEEWDIRTIQDVEELGINNRKPDLDGDIDGFGSNDTMLFSFSSAIRVFTVLFENVTNNGGFVFYLPTAHPTGTDFAIINPSPFDTDGNEDLFNFWGIELLSFGIGARGVNDDFRMSRLEVETVPLLDGC